MQQGGAWWMISDILVTLETEAQALEAQAYVLAYTAI